MKKELPLNSMPILACYGYESYNDAIASSKLYVNDIVALIDKISINGSPVQKSIFKFTSESLMCENNSDELVFTAQNHATHLKGLLYLKVSGNFELSFHVKQHIYNSPWSLISAFVANELDVFNDKYSKTNKPYMFGYFKKTGYCKFIGNESKSVDLSIKNNNTYWIKIRTLKNKVYSYASLNGSDWNNICCDSTKINDKYYIGIYLDIGEYSYYNWLYSNHIQIYCSNILSKCYTPIEYFSQNDTTGTTKTNPFICEYKIPYNLIKTYDIKIESMIKYCIDNTLYLDLPLNEKFIRNRWAYNNRNYTHYNMIFGYNDENNSASVYGYNEQSKVSASVIDYDSLQAAFNQSDGQDVILRKYDMGYYPEELNVNLIRNLIEDYLYSKDSSWRYSGICVKRDNCSFGISVYDCITNNENNFLHFLCDLRAAYFLTEHKKIMKERVAFLIKKNIVSGYFAHTLVKKSEKLYDVTSAILLLVMKYKVIKDESIKDILKKHLITVKTLDIDLCSNLLRSIDKSFDR